MDQQRTTYQNYNGYKRQRDRPQKKAWQQQLDRSGNNIGVMQYRIWCTKKREPQTAWEPGRSSTWPRAE